MSNSFPTDKGPVLINADGSTQLPGNLTVVGSTTMTGGQAAAGGFTVSPRNVHTGGTTIMVAADGTDTTPVATETYVSEIFIPCNMTVTGIAHFNGSAAATDSICSILYNSAGVAVAQTAAAGTLATGIDSFQRIALTAPYAAVGPATYYIGTQANGVTTRLNTHTIGNFNAQKKTGETFGVATTLTIAGTFTTAVGIIASLY